MDKLIESLKGDIENTKRAIQLGKYVHTMTKKETKMTEDDTFKAEAVIQYLENYLIPYINKINE